MYIALIISFLVLAFKNYVIFYKNFSCSGTQIYLLCYYMAMKRVPALNILHHGFLLSLFQSADCDCCTQCCQGSKWTFATVEGTCCPRHTYISSYFMENHHLVPHSSLEVSGRKTSPVLCVHGKQSHNSFGTFNANYIFTHDVFFFSLDFLEI